MKKRDYKKRNVKLNIYTKRHLRELERKDVYYNTNKLKALKNPFLGKEIKAPVNFSFYEVANDDFSDYSESIDFLNKISRHTAIEKCLIDFSETTRITAAATLVLYSVIHSNIKDNPYKSTLRFSASKSVNRLLRRHNIQDLLRNVEFKPVFDGSRDLQVFNGYGKDHLDDVIDYIEKRIYERDMPTQDEFYYSSAVGETISNVNRHAYPNLQPDKKPWWLILDMIGDEIYLAIYDKGVGIPNTVIHRKWFLPTLKKSFSTIYKNLEKESSQPDLADYKLVLPHLLNDAELIYLSMLGDASQILDEKHGQGSKSIKALVTENTDGHLWVFSNDGLYCYTNEKDQQRIELPKSFKGTLLQWNIKIQ